MEVSSLPHSAPTVHHVASADGTVIGFERLGAGPVLVLVLGAMGTAYTFREIAQALYVTQRTVEFHLTSIYRKLAISSRSQLAAALAEPART